MYAVSAEFLATIEGSHAVVSKAVVASSGVELRVLGGSVSVDLGSAIRRSLRMTVLDVDGTVMPNQAGTSGLLPYGAELQIYRGVVIPSTGVAELVPQGIFRISEVAPSDDGSQQVSVVAYDRSRAISRNKLVEPYIVAANSSYATAISNLAINRMPGLVVINQIGSGGSTPLLVFDSGADPWAEIETMAATIGAIVYFNVLGQLVIAPVPTPAESPVDSFVEGSSATVLGVERAVSDDPGYNGVVVTGESTTVTSPVRAVAWDTDATSPTYYLGPYGQVPMFVTSPYVATAAQAYAQAKTLLQENLGGTENVTFSAIPNPALEVGDTVQLTRTEVGVDQLAVLQRFDLPLSAAEPMQCTTRQRRVVAA